MKRKRSDPPLVSFAARFDLRKAFDLASARAAMPQGEGEGEGGGGDDNPTEEELVKNPKMKKLSEEAGRYRTLLRQQEARAQELEAQLNGSKTVGEVNAQLKQQLESAQAIIKNLSIRQAFEKAAREEGIGDVDAAFLLAADNLRDVSFDDKNIADAVQVKSALKKVVDRHPSVLGTKDLQASGRPANGKLEPSSRAALEAKFPALRRRAAESGPFTPTVSGS
jgi:hypothetical protein